MPMDVDHISNTTERIAEDFNDDQKSDSGLEDVCDSETDSITSQDYQFRYDCDGRRYHSDPSSDYMLPNDERELSRLDDMHEFWALTFENHHIIAPISHPKQILDVGCGTGLWAIEVADRYPRSQVYGVDISPIQPLYVAENCYFYLENALEGLSFQDQSFDLVQSRCLGAGIPDKRWLSYVQELWRITKPGGWVQLIEIDPLRYCDDGSMPAQSPLAEFESISERVMKYKYGITIHGVGPKLAYHAQNAGFINVTQVNIKSPLGMWTQHQTGWMIAKNWAELLCSAKQLLRDGMPNASEAEINTLLESAQNELLHNTYHAYYMITAVWAQRPYFLFEQMD